MKLQHSLIAAAFALASFINQASAQNISVTIDTKEQKQVIDSVTRLLNDNYIFPEMAKKMNELIEANYKKGAYASLTSAPTFANKLTEDLRSVSHDKHLGVNFDPNMVKELKANPSLSNDDDIPPAFIEDVKMRNYGFQEVKILPGNIGYLDLRGFIDPKYGAETAVAAMNFLSNASAIIFDLRQNGGGSPAMIQLLTSYLYGSQSVHLNNFYYRPTNETTQTWTLPYVQGKRRPDVDVYILTSGRTFSAAEEFTYNLKNLKRAVVVGEVTGGGAHPGGSRVVNDRFAAFIPIGRAINPITNTNWEGTGVKPDVIVPSADALLTAQTIALDSLSKKATGGAKEKYKWELVSLQAKKEPYKVDEATMKAAVGEFGQKKVVFEDGNLYFYPFPDNKVKLVPLAKDLYQLDGIDHVRLRVHSENNVVTAIEELFQNGYSEKHEKKVM